MYTVSRYHDISCGHRVSGHESKCQHLHGHNYRIHFHCQSKEIDSIGRVIDFSEVKSRLCMWLENNWDHRFLAWENDDLMIEMAKSLGGPNRHDMFFNSVVWVPFNPTAENMAEYLVRLVGPIQLKGTGIKLVRCEVEETRKCSASYEDSH